MRGRGQGNAVLHDILAAVGDAPDVCGLSLGLSATIDHTQACHRAAVVIGVKHVAAEGGAAHLAVDQELRDPPLIRR